MSYEDGPIPVPTDDTFLVENVQRISICDSGSLTFLSLKSVSLESNPKMKLTFFLSLFHLNSVKFKPVNMVTFLYHG